MRGDLEMLGYNLFQWSSGSMLWDHMWSFAKIQQSKREFLDELESMRKFFRYEHLGIQIISILHKHLFKKITLYLK